ncbi:MAG: protein kinase [Planctomycetaceae bacterium]
MDVLTLSDFELLEELHATEQFTVFHATQPGSGRDVRVTVFDRGLSDIPQFRAAFRKDCGRLEHLHHDTVLQYLGHGEADGALFYFSEYPGGLTLTQRLERGQQFSWDEIADLGWQIASALQFAHNLGISHSGLTTDSVLVSDVVRVKVADFGVSRWIDSADDRLEKHTEADWLNSQAADLTAFGEILEALSGARDSSPDDSVDDDCSGATVQSEIHRLANDLKSPGGSRFPATAREVQGRLGNLLLSVAGESIRIVDHRAGQSYGKRSIVDELFDDAETLDIAPPRSGAPQPGASGGKESPGSSVAVVIAAIVIATIVITIILLTRQ